MTNETEIFTGSLIGLYPKVEPLSAIKKFAISQNVAFNFEWSLKSYMRNEGKESKAFATFVTLIQADINYYGNYIECLIEEQDVSEEVINKVLESIRSGVIPYQIWIDKIVADTKSGGDYYSPTSVASIFLVYLLKTMRTSLIGFNKFVSYVEREQVLSENLMKVVEIAKLNYYAMPQRLKQEYQEAFASVDEVTRRAFQDNELTLFCNTLIDMLQCPLSLPSIDIIESGQGNIFSTYWADPPMGCGISLTNNSRSPLPKKVDENGEEIAETKKNKKAGMGSFAVDVLGWGADGSTPEELEKREEESLGGLPQGTNEDNGYENEEVKKDDRPVVQYVVKKIAKHGSSRVMSENMFSTLEEAEKFRRDVLDAVPDMANAFDFKIEKVYL